MGMFKDFAKAFKEGYGEKQEDQPQSRNATSDKPRKMQTFATYNGYVNLPYLVHMCMTQGTVDVRGMRMFEEAVSKLPVMTRLEFTLRKTTKNDMPDGWDIAQGTMSVLTESGEIVGTVDAKRFEKLGKNNKRYGFVEPPSYDFSESIPIAPKRRVFLFCDYNKVYNESAGVEVGWTP